MQNTLPVLRVELSQRHQTIHTFGASACWWAPGAGTLPQARALMRLLFSDDGLGLNNIRINIGGSVRSDRSDSVSSDPAWRGVLSPLCEDGSYDIRRCAGTWEIAHLANQMQNIDDITLFMNSPPSSMTKNGKTNSDDSGQEGVFISNLRDDCYERYAKYVADVTELFVDAGIRVKYVSPINEPQWAWNGGQEGCHYEPDELVRMMRLCIREWEWRKQINPALVGVKLSLPETAQWYQVPYVHDIYALMCTDPEIASHVDHFCAHSYGTTRQQKTEFAQYTAGLGKTLPLHQTEWGPMHAWHDASMDTALELAAVLHDDFTILHVDSWSWWLGLGSFTYTDGLICVDHSLERIEFPKRYFVMKQHSRYLRGHTCVTVEKHGLPEEICGSAYLSPDDNRLVWELVNPCTQDISLMLEGMPAGCSGHVIETSDRYSCREAGIVCADNPITLPARSVLTLVFSNIKGAQT